MARSKFVVRVEIEVILVQVDDCPLVVQAADVEHHPLDLIRVLFGDGVDSAEGVNELIVEAGHAVVVSSKVQLGHLRPLVDYAVVELDSALGRVQVFSRPTDDNVSFCDLSERMALSWVSHPPPLLEKVSAIVLLDQLSALEHGIWKSPQLTSSDDERSRVFDPNLDRHEVMGNCILHLDLHALARLGLRVDNGDCLLLLVEHVDQFRHQNRFTHDIFCQSPLESLIDFGLPVLQHLVVHEAF